MNGAWLAFLRWNNQRVVRCWGCETMQRRGRLRKAIAYQVAADHRRTHGHLVTVRRG